MTKLRFTLAALVILDIAGRPLWWFLLYLIPGVNIIIACIVMHDISKSFGHGIGSRSASS